ncbi:MAG: CPBP family glutamic-type intramembrane protease, partial [Candidatus Heimdallarchaeaceae archaeon]
WWATFPVSILINVAFQVVYTTAAGFVFAYLFVKTESLVPSILSHYILDAFGPFLQAIVVAGGVTFSELAIVRTSQTIIGVGIVPTFVNVLIIFLVYRFWKKKPFLESVDVTEAIPETETVNS